MPRVLAKIFHKDKHKNKTIKEMGKAALTCLYGPNNSITEKQLTIF